MIINPSCELRLGRWQDVLADVGTVDAVIVDAPYSEKTHAGHTLGATYCREEEARRPINYVSWSRLEVDHFVSNWAPRCRGWMVSITDHTLAQEWARSMEEAGRYVFAPLPLVEPGGRVRLSGDGPSSWTCWIVVSRPRSRDFMSWGTLPGAYVVPTGHGENQKLVTGGKPLWAMERLVEDYSRPGDLICDPCAGGATTLIAAAMHGRRAIGAEMDPETHAKAVKRLKRGYTPAFDFGA